MVTELEDRLSNHIHRGDLETVELVKMVKDASVVQKGMEEEREDTGVVMNIISHMPKKKYEKDDDDDETVH